MTLVVYVTLVMYEQDGIIDSAGIDVPRVKLNT